MTRAIGDLDLKKFIISEPEITQMTIEEDDDLLILCSDGLLRVYDHDMLAARLHLLRQEQLSQGHDLSFISRNVIDEACQNFYCRDNVSLVVVDLAKHYRDNLARFEAADLKEAASLDLRRIHSQLSFPNFPPHPQYMGFDQQTIPSVGYPMILPMHQDMMKHWTPQVGHNPIMQHSEESSIVGAHPKFQPTYMHPS